MSPFWVFYTIRYHLLDFARKNIISCVCVFAWMVSKSVWVLIVLIVNQFFIRNILLIIWLERLFLTLRNSTQSSLNISAMKKNINSLFVAVLLMWRIRYSQPAYLLKVNYRNTRIRCEICSKLTKKTPKCNIGVSLVPLLLSIVNSVILYCSHLFLAFLWFTLNM